MYIRGPCASWTLPSGKYVCTRSHYFTTCNCAFNFNFLAVVVSGILGGVPNLHYGALRPPYAPSGKMLTHPSSCLYHYNCKVSACSSINARLTESSLYNRFALKGPPKWGFGVILGVGVKIFGGKYIRPQNCAFLDIFGPDLTRRL